MEQRLAEEQIGRRATAYSISASDDYDDDDLPAAEMEDTEERVVDQASAAQTIAELEAEIRMLKDLEHMADSVRQSGTDRKWDELSKLLQDDATMFEGDGTREKLIIFTEHRDTLRYLTDKIRSLLGWRRRSSPSTVACSATIDARSRSCSNRIRKSAS